MIIVSVATREARVRKRRVEIVPKKNAQHNALVTASAVDKADFETCLDKIRQLGVDYHPFEKGLN